MTPQEQLLFVETGAKLHCDYWADNEAGHVVVRIEAFQQCLHRLERPDEVT